MLSTIIFYAVLFSVAVAWLYGILFLVLLFENRRFWKSRQKLAAPMSESQSRVSLLIPCKGMEHRLRENLTAFVRQDHPNFDISFIVESESDSAVNLIRNIMRENRHVRSRLVVAGYASDCGQKVHNLRHATQELEPDTEILVFADSDANPQPSWLRWIVSGISKPGVGARTGYRWMIPGDKSLATLLGVSINNAVAAMLGPGSHLLVWGGSWAIHRKVFDATGIQDTWKGVLSDDLVASRTLRYSKLAVEFEPRCICTSNVKFTYPSLVEFLRRQLLIGRQYCTNYWLTALATASLTTLGFWGGLFAGIGMVASGNSNGYWLIGSSVGLYGLGVLRGFMRQNMGRIVTAEWRQQRSAQKFDITSGPITSLLTTIMLTVSAFGNRINWRGIRYHIGQGGRILLLGRKMSTKPWPFVVNTPAKNDTSQPDTNSERRAA